MLWHTHKTHKSPRIQEMVWTQIQGLKFWKELFMSLLCIPIESEEELALLDLFHTLSNMEGFLNQKPRFSKRPFTMFQSLNPLHQRGSERSRGLKLKPEWFMRVNTVWQLCVSVLLFIATTISSFRWIKLCSHHQICMWKCQISCCSKD